MKAVMDKRSKTIKRDKLNKINDVSTIILINIKLGT